MKCGGEEVKVALSTTRGGGVEVLPAGLSGGKANQNVPTYSVPSKTLVSETHGSIFYLSQSCSARVRIQVG